MKRLYLPVSLLLLGTTMWAPADGWNNMEKQFREMPMEARRFVQPLFWLHGDESKQRLEMYLEKVAEGHNGGFCAESRPHNDWLGEGWFRDLDICLKSAKKHDLKMWIFDEKWWPSQTVANKVPLRYRAKKLITSSWVIEEGEHLERPGFDSRNLVAVIAGRQTGNGLDPDSLIDLRPYIQDGVLSWDSPPGRWEVVVFKWTLAPNTTQANQVSVDGASQDCVDWFLRTVYQPHYDRFGRDYGTTIVGYFYDEPETQGDWGTEISRILAERGVDEKKALLAWKGMLAGEEQVAARYAYVDALAETWGRTMYGSSLRWCEERNVALIGHFIEHDGWYLRPGLGALNIFQMQKYNSMGGMDLVCQQLWPGERKPGIYQLPKLTSSISHAYGKADDLAMTEIFGAYGQQITYPQMKWLLDWHQVGGVNFMIPHSFNPRAPNDTDCPPYFYNGGEEPRWPLYRVWADYSNRLSLLLTGGRHVCPVAFLFCGNSAYVGRAVTPEDMTSTLQDALYDCDWLPYEVLENDVRIAGNELSLRDERYRVLIVPPVEAIPYATLARARDFFQAGGIVVGYDFLPSKSATLGRSSDDIRALVRAIWGDGEASLAVRKTNPAGGRSYFLPARVTPEEIARVLGGDAGVPPALEVLDGNTGNWLHVLHRQKDGRDVFFVCNQNHEGEARSFRFRARAEGVPECWDAMRNEITSIPFERTSDGVEFSLTMEPMESVLLVFGPGKPARPVRLDGQRPLAVIPVTGNARPREDEASPGLLECAWVWYPEGDPRSAVPPGTRWFRKEIVIPEGRSIRGARFVLTADNEFELFVNGRLAGRNVGGGELWRSPKDFQIAGFLKPGRNVFAIAATNLGEKPNPAGLIGRYWISFKEGSPIFGSIDATWKACASHVAGWNAVSFDDSGWVLATEIAQFGEAPWGNVGRFIMPANPFRGECAVPKDLDLSRSRVYLEMEDLQEGASVKVNGEFAGGVIGRPFRLDVTRLIRPGANTIEIEPYAPSAVRLVIYPG